MKSVKEVISTSYRQLLKGTEWKAFSRDVRNKYGNACQICKRSNIPTEVHHLFYDKDRMPWEYKTSEVVLLCGGCHKKMHKHLKVFRQTAFGRLTPATFRVLNLALVAGLQENDPLTFVYAVLEMAVSPRSVKRFCDAWINRPLSDRREVETKTDDDD